MGNSKICMYNAIKYMSLGSLSSTNQKKYYIYKSRLKLCKLLVALPKGKILSSLVTSVA